MCKKKLVDEKISKSVLFVGIDYKHPKGGIASVLSTYSTFISPFKFITTSGTGLCSSDKFLYAIKGFLLLIVRLVFDRTVKIVHIHSASGTSFYRKCPIILLSKFFDKKVIFHCHGGGFKVFREKNRKFVDFILGKCDIIVGLSEMWKEYFNKISRHEVVVIKNVISEPTILNVNHDNKVHLLFLGKICEEKGVYDLLKALSLHKGEFMNRLVLHIGGNHEVEKLKTLIFELDLNEFVKFEGWVDDEKKSQLLNLCDIFILPSYIEGVPISILEAESYSKPIISTNVGGIPSIVKDGKNGILITPGSLEDIYIAIRSLVNNPNLRLNMGREGYIISKDYLPMSIAEQLTELYSRLLN